MTVPSDPRPSFDYAGRDQRHWSELDRLIESEGIGTEDLLTNWPAYIRRRDMVRFLSHYELFKNVIDLPGCILELGVYKGSSFFTWTKLLETFCPGDRSRRVYGFDHFEGLVDFTEDDGKDNVRIDKVHGGWKASAHHARTLVELHNDDNLIAGVTRCQLVEGNVLETIPKFIEDNPGLRIALLYLDMDLYEPTRFALEHLYPLVLEGGVVAFDEYALPSWEGETRAADELTATLSPRPRLRKHPFAVHPTGWFIKGETR
jgi:hypothetical protein